MGGGELCAHPHKLVRRSPASSHYDNKAHTIIRGLQRDLMSISLSELKFCLSIVSCETSDSNC